MALANRIMINGIFGIFLLRLVRQKAKEKPRIFINHMRSGKLYYLAALWGVATAVSRHFSPNVMVLRKAMFMVILVMMSRIKAEDCAVDDHSDYNVGINCDKLLMKRI